MSHRNGDGDESVHWFEETFATNLYEAVGGSQAVTLNWPSLEYRGRSAAGDDLPVTSWRVTIGMYVGDIEAGDERRLDVGFLELFSVPLYPGTTEALDAVSTDTADYLALFSGSGLNTAVREQFDSHFASGMLILDRAYVHPALRGHDIGAWAAVQALDDLTFGANVIVVTHPAPIDRRHGISEELSTTALAMYWTKAGFETIKACPGLMGLSTIGDALANASQSLTIVPNLQLTFFKRDLDVFSVDP